MSVLWRRSINGLRRRAASLKKQRGHTEPLDEYISGDDDAVQVNVNGTHVQEGGAATLNGIHIRVDPAGPDTINVASRAPHNAAAEEALLKREEAVRQDKEAQLTQNQESRFKLINRLNGAFNVAYIFENAHAKKVCVRVPACGWIERWTEADADLLRATALGMRYMEKTSDLPIPRILSYDTTMDNEIAAPFTIMTFLEGTSLSVLWEQQDETLEILETRRQNILQSLARIMCTLATTTFRTAGTLWFPGDDDCEPVVGRSFRLDKRNIFMLRHEFLTFEAKDSVAELLLEGRDKRFEAEGFPDRCATNVERGVLALWGVMIDAFLQSATLDQGLPEFVLMQSDFNPQNILADEQGNVTGIIDWDCLESIPRQIGWCSVPHWLEADWYPDWKWPPDLGTARTASPDDFERYRNDYARYMREACPDAVDTRFTSKSHIYQALLDSTEHFEKVENFVYNVIADILPRNSYPRGHVGSIGEYGFRQGEREWFETRLLRYFAPEAVSLR